MLLRCYVLCIASWAVAVLDARSADRTVVRRVVDAKGVPAGAVVAAASRMAPQHQHGKMSQKAAEEAHVAVLIGELIRPCSVTLSQTFAPVLKGTDVFMSIEDADGAKEKVEALQSLNHFKGIELFNVSKHAVNTRRMVQWERVARAWLLMEKYENSMSFQYRYVARVRSDTFPNSPLNHVCAGGCDADAIYSESDKFEYGHRASMKLLAQFWHHISAHNFSNRYVGTNTAYQTQNWRVLGQAEKGCGWIDVLNFPKAVISEDEATGLRWTAKIPELIAHDKTLKGRTLTPTEMVTGIRRRAHQASPKLPFASEKQYVIYLADQGLVCRKSRLGGMHQKDKFGACASLMDDDHPEFASLAFRLWPIDETFHS